MEPKSKPSEPVADLDAKEVRATEAEDVKGGQSHPVPTAPVLKPINPRTIVPCV